MSNSPAHLDLRSLLLAALFIFTLSPAATGLAVASFESPSLQPLSLEAYTGELDRWLDAVNRLKDHPEEAARLREQLPPAWVVLVDGQRFEVSTDWLRAALGTFEKNPKAPGAGPELLRTRLQALQRGARALAQAPPLPAGRARQKLQEILARREFREVHGPTWLERLIERLNRWLTALFNRLSMHPESHPAAGPVLLWALIIIAAGCLLVWMVRWVLQRPRTLRLDLAEAPRPAATWEQMTREARAAAGRGNFRDAIRLAFWAGIIRLEDLGLWTADRARTHREYLRLLTAGHPQREPLAILAHQFERAWYAGQPASAEDFQAVLSQLEKLGCVFPSTRAIERS